jgi:hypothetical protein
VPYTPPRFGELPEDDPDDPDASRTVDPDDGETMTGAEGVQIVANEETLRRAIEEQRRRDLEQAKATFTLAQQALLDAKKEMRDPLPGDGEVPPAPPVDGFTDPDSTSSEDPLVNINANLVVAIRMLYAFHERDERFARSDRAQMEALINAVAHSGDQNVSSQLAYLNDQLRTSLNPDPVLTKLRRWIHRKTADPRPRR